MGKIKRYSNKAQLIRAIADETGEPLDELWKQLEEQTDE